MYKTPFKDITGQRFGRLLTLAFLGRQKRKNVLKTMWMFKCDCGNYIETSIGSVQSGYRKSCDCLRLNQKGKNHPHYIHGRSRDKDYLFERHLKHAYNITIEEYNELKIKQNYCCAICKKKKKLSVDHNHKTGKIRSLLCHRCNIRVGFIEKDKLLMDTLNYLNFKIKGKLKCQL